MTTRVKAVDALLVIDVGNTRVGMAVWDADGVHDGRHVMLAEPQSWPPAFERTWAVTRAQRRRAVVIGSVVPSATERVRRLAGEVCGVDPVCVRSDIPLPMPVDVDSAEEVGVDRVCSAAAAYDRIHQCCAVASFGSATTIDCVSNDGRFMGGAILPGFDLACDVLHERTAALPLVTPDVPRTPFGKNTREAILAGVGYGLVGALREIVERFATELREWPQLVITGGRAPLISELADFVDHVVPNLCLMGVALAYRKAAEQS